MFAVMLGAVNFINLVSITLANDEGKYRDLPVEESTQSMRNVC